MAFNIAEVFKRNTTNAPKIEMLKIDSLIANENNFYRVSNEPEIELQNEQIKASIDMYGILQPLRVADLGNGKYKIIVGERRYLACKRLIAEGKSIESVPCIVERQESAEDEQIKLIVTNQHRDISNAERLEEVKQLTSLIKKKRERGEKIPGSMDKIIADMLHISKSEVGRLQQVNKNLEPDLKKAVGKGKLSMSAATELSKLSPAEQKAVYEKTGGAIKAKDAKKVKQPTSSKEPENLNLDGFAPPAYIPKPPNQKKKESQHDVHQLIYCAHKYRDMSIKQRESNRQHAREKVVKLIAQYPDFCFINPIEAVSWLSYALPGNVPITKTEEIAMRHCLALLSKCNQLWVLSEISEGVKIEIAFAKAHNIAILYMNGEDNDEKD